MKSGFKTSEFWIAVLAGAVYAASAKLGFPIEYGSLFGILSVAYIYIKGRFSLKKATFAEAKKTDEYFKLHVKNVSDVLMPQLVAEIEKKSKIAAIIAKKAINNEVDKL